ncbi:MAG: response regulator transcription factor [Cytophagales bacterium]|nr:response regulator transcription factor [Rhizobacter sp.]
MNQRTVYVVDDNREFLDSAKWWLEGAGYDVLEFDAPRAALAALATPLPQSCLLLDVRMPDMSGLALHDELRERGVRMPVVYMTGHGDVPLAVEAMRKGAVTFIEKPFADEALQRALEMAFNPVEASAENAHVAIATVNATMTPATAPIEPQGSPVARAAMAERNARFSRLTAREREVVGLVMQEKRNKVIADRLNISIKTVELHRKNAMTKLGARSVIELTRVMVSLQGAA